MNISESELIKKVGEKTGLKDREEILAYMNFSECADWDDGVIMYGDAQHKFYESLLEKADIKTKKKEKDFWELVGNHKTKKKESKLSLKAKSEYAKYLKIFIEKGLIQEPKLVRKCTTKYPVLCSYNYFNDFEIYEIAPDGERNLKEYSQ